MTIASICVPSMSPNCLLPSPRGFLKSATESAPGSFELPFCHRSQSMWGLCVHYKSWVSLSYILLVLQKANPTGFWSQTLAELIFQCTTPRLGSLMWSLNTSALGENLRNCDYPPACGLSTRKRGSWLCCVSPSPVCLVVASSFYF